MTYDLHLPAKQFLLAMRWITGVNTTLRGLQLTPVFISANDDLLILESSDTESWRRATVPIASLLLDKPGTLPQFVTAGDSFVQHAAFAGDGNVMLSCDIDNNRVTSVTCKAGPAKLSSIILNPEDIPRLTPPPPGEWSLTVEEEQLAWAMNAAAAASAKRPEEIALEYINLQIDKEGLTISSTDRYRLVQAKVPAKEVTGQFPGVLKVQLPSTLVNEKMLKPMGKTLQICVVDGNRLTIRGDGFETACILGDQHSPEVQKVIDQLGKDTWAACPVRELVQGLKFTAGSSGAYTRARVTIQEDGIEVSDAVGDEVKATDEEARTVQVPLTGSAGVPLSSFLVNSSYLQSLLGSVPGDEARLVVSDPSKVRTIGVTGQDDSYVGIMATIREGTVKS